VTAVVPSLYCDRIEEMEIRTAKANLGRPAAGTAVPPDRGAYLRRKSSQRLRKRQVVSRRVIRTLQWTLRLAAAMAALAVLVTGYRYTASSARFDVRNVICQGCAQMRPAQIEEIVRRDFPRSILQIDLEKLRGRLEKERWIRGVQIRRVLPGSLVIYVDERKPAAVVELNGELMLADRDGILLDHYTEDYGKLDIPVFAGFLGQSAGEYARNQEPNSLRVALGMRLLEELGQGSEDYLRRISEVDLADTRNVRILMVDDTAEVFLGDRNFLERFRAFVANMPQYEELKAQYSEIASVDLRYDGKIIYRPRNVSDTPVEAERPKQP